MAGVSYDHGRHRCPACLCFTKPTSVTVDGDGTLRRLERCTGCGSQSWSGSARAATTSNYWQGHKAFDLYSSSETRAAYHQRYRRAHAAMTKVLGRQPERVLDYGGGIGNYGAWLEGQGVETLTLDTDRGAVDVARGRGLNACLPEELATTADPNGYDVVTLWDVIEHTDKPADLLATALVHVSPGGLAFLETPDAGFPLRAAVRAAHRASGGRLDLTSPMYYWEHKTYLTRAGLRTLLARTGFAETWSERWTSPREKMVKIFDREGSGADRSSLYRALARIYPLASEVVELLGGGNKQIVIARRVT